ncbi:unnamed protein product [Linum trigynum]|uniref:Uncharacterized protein n=1 Tax=Linum trigynum TaxID=586398 RepID=A0AAV2DIM9_9ROSI
MERLQPLGKSHVIADLGGKYREGRVSMPVSGHSCCLRFLDRIIFMLHQDVYLLGTVMLVFGMGLHELFISNLSPSKTSPGERIADRPNMFGLFTLKERPRWLEVKTEKELKTKLGHVIVMLLLIGFFREE